MSRQLPGDTETFGEPLGVPEATEPLCTMAAAPPIEDRKIVLLATATITDDNIFSNGLFQNVFFLYRMFDAMGYAPIMLVHEKPKTLENIPAMLRKCRTLSSEQLLKQPLPVIAMIEIGMSIEPMVRKFVKMLGGRLIKLYLGNILNIDVETPIFYPGMYFAHHVVGNSDLVLVSPHYGQHAEYASYLNHVKPAAGGLHTLVGPYVWDPAILTRDGTVAWTWTPPRRPEDQVFIVTEPNISFQKASFVPLLAIERWYRDIGKAAGWAGKVVVVNGDRLERVPHAMETFLPRLSLWRDERIELSGRKSLAESMQAYPSATFVCHQYNNEFNYMSMELLWAGFPLVHNSDCWAKYGYSYSGADIGAAAAAIEEARRRHAERLEVYRGHARAIAWRYSPYNPEIQTIWRQRVEGPLLATESGPGSAPLPEES